MSTDGGESESGQRDCQSSAVVLLVTSREVSEYLGAYTVTAQE